MKKTSLLLLLFIAANFCKAQVSGNINYINGVQYAQKNIDIPFPGSKSLLVTVSCMANIKADSCVAIFSLTQTGKTTEEVNTLMDDRLNECITKIKTKKNIFTYVDMISFVPMYGYYLQKKIFSKRTYNEVPAGFELKKNIHIRYSNPDDLNEIIAILAAAEIYDLVRVDYFSAAVEANKKELMAKARTIMLDKMKNYELLLGKKLDSLDKQLADGYRAVLPVEMYKSYQAYNNSSLNEIMGKVINTAEKSTTLYYQPVLDKEFDFVINPVVFEPVIQVMYEIKMVINLEKEKLAPAANEKEYFFITTTGEVKSINISSSNTKQYPQKKIQYRKL